METNQDILEKEVAAELAAFQPGLMLELTHDADGWHVWLFDYELACEASASEAIHAAKSKARDLLGGE